MRDTEGNILQLRYQDKPWKVLVVCILLNRTRRTDKFDKIVEQLFYEFPIILSFAHYRDRSGVRDEAKFIEILRPLGLCNRRAKMLYNFSNDVNDFGLSPETVLNGKIRGLGPYARDCYMIMYHGQRHLNCTDGALQNYIVRIKKQESP